MLLQKIVRVNEKIKWKKKFRWEENCEKLLNLKIEIDTHQNLKKLKASNPKLKILVPD